MMANQGCSSLLSHVQAPRPPTNNSETPIAACIFTGTGVLAEKTYCPTLCLFYQDYHTTSNAVTIVSQFEHSATMVSMSARSSLTMHDLKKKKKSSLFLSIKEIQTVSSRHGTTTITIQLYLWLESKARRVSVAQAQSVNRTMDIANNLLKYLHSPVMVNRLLP